MVIGAAMQPASNPTSTRTSRSSPSAVTSANAALPTSQPMAAAPRPPSAISAEPNV